MRPLAHLEMLHSLSVRMTRAHSDREVGEAVVTELTNLIDHHACRFYLLSEAGDMVIPVAHEGTIAEYVDDRTADLVCRVGEGVAGGAIVDARARRIPDASVDSYAVDVPGSEPVDESMMVAPILSDGEPIGAIVLSRLGLDQFDDTDLHVLEVVAAKAAAACENVRLYASMREAAEVSEALLELGAALALQGSVEAVAEMLARAVDRLVDSAAISVWLRRGDDMTLAAHAGYTPLEARRLAASPVPASEPPFAGNLDSRALAVCEPGQAGALASQLETVAPGTTFAVVPVGERAANRAAIVVQRGQRRGAPGRRDELMLLGIADQALLAMVNRSLYTELEASFLATVEALGNALGTKDEYTGDHAQALVGLTTNVARRMGLTGAGAARHHGGGRPARRRQDRRPGCHLGQAGPAHRRGVGGHAPPSGARREDHGAGAGAGRRPPAGGGLSRALGRQRLPPRPARRGDPPRVARDPGLRRVPRHDL